MTNDEEVMTIHVINEEGKWILMKKWEILLLMKRKNE